MSCYGRGCNTQPFDSPVMSIVTSGVGSLLGAGGSSISRHGRRGSAFIQRVRFPRSVNLPRWGSVETRSEIHCSGEGKERRDPTRRG